MMKIICLPFAGAGYYSYRPIFNNQTYFEPIYCELPGRERRISEPVVSSLYEAAEDIYKQIRLLLHGKYVLWGHSMGTEIARLLLEKMLCEGDILPIHLFVSGREAPSVDKRNNRYQLPRGQFTEALRKLGGVPEEILGNNEVMDFFEPILRNDFKLIETFFEPELSPLSLPVSVLIGDRDEVRQEEAWPWQKITSGNFDLKIMSGNHFFIFDQPGDLLAYFIKRIETCTK